MEPVSDAQLVEQVLDGDRGALGEIYDRYSGPIHDLCLHMLRSADEAADATAEVFLTAAEHLDQIRDRSKLRSWLYAVARNEVYRRTRRRGREQVMSEGFDDLVDLTEAHAGAEPDDLMRLVREAAAGLDDRDRLVMELTLAGGIDGRELGDALGLDVAAAHQASHRMRERLGRSVGALLVARQGRADCAELEKLLAGWDGSFSVLWRKRVSRHIDGCARCERRRRKVPVAVLSGVAFAETLPVRFVAPPQELRGRVLGAAVVGGGQPLWGGEGFPPAPGDPKRGQGRLVAAAAVLVLVGVGLGVSLALADRDRAQRVATGSTVTPPTSTVVVAGTVATSAQAPTTAIPPSPSVTPPPATTVPETPTTAAVTTAPKSTVPPAAAPTVPPTTAAITTLPSLPSVGLLVPPLVGPGPCGANDEIVVTTSVGVVSVDITWKLVAAATTTGTLSVTQQSSTRWVASWQPLDEGTYTVWAAAVDAFGRQVTASQSGSVGYCIG